MGTKHTATNYELLHLSQFIDSIPGIDQELDRSTVLKLASLGGLQVSTLFELAIARTSGWLHDSVKGRDFADHSDAKYVTCRRHSSGACYGAKISGLHNKRGDLRVQVLCPQATHSETHSFYYFIIPYEQYQHIRTESGCLEIPFRRDGTPDRQSQNRWGRGNIWQYEVETFQRMALSSSGMEQQKSQQGMSRLFDGL